MLFHVNFFDQSSGCFSLILRTLFIGTRTRFDVAFLKKIEFFEPNIIALLDFFYVLFKLEKLPTVLISRITDDMLSEILGDEKLLLYYFIEA